MSTVTKAQLQQNLSEARAQLKILNDRIATLSEQNKILTEVENFDLFMIQTITPTFGEETARNIVRVLQKCRREEDFRYFIGVYHWRSLYGNIQYRQMLKLISAAYRIRYAKNHDNNRYSLASEIKYATACDHCGKLAKALRNRLVKEGYLKV